MSSWIAIIVILLAGLYVFFSPTGNVIYEPEGAEVVSTDIAACQALDSGGTYVLTADVVASENDSECFVVSAADVVLDLGGHDVGDENASVPSVVIGGVSGVVVKNGVLSGNGTTIALTGNASATAVNMTLGSQSVESGSLLHIEWYVSVVVVDQDGAGVEGAVVFVGNDSGTSDGSGVVLASKGDGNYSVSVSAEGYTNASGGAVVSGDNVVVSFGVNDTQAPTVSYTSSIVGVLNVTLSLSVTENGVLESCSAWYANGTDENDTVVEVLDGATDGGSLFVSDLALGTTYEMHAGCVDTAGHAGNSSLFNVTTLSEDPVPAEEDSSDDSSDDDDSDSGSSSSSSSSSSDKPKVQPPPRDVNRVYVVSDEAFEKTGSAKVLDAKDKIQFEVDGTRYFVALKEVFGGQVAVLEVLKGERVLSPLSLGLGGSERVDVQEDGTYDLFVLFRGLKDGGKAELFVKGISEPVGADVPEAETDIAETTEVQGGSLTGLAVEEDVGTTSTATKIVVALLVLIVIVFWLIRRKKKSLVPA